MGGVLSHQAVIERYLPLIDGESLDFLRRAVESIVEAKQNGRKVVVATGSGPNLHEGVTTLIAELMAKGIIDGILTSSAVVAAPSFGMAGCLNPSGTMR